MSQAYAGVLEALVAGTKSGPSFMCELSGEGILPSLSLEQAWVKGAAGPKPLVFPKTLLVCRGSPFFRRTLNFPDKKPGMVL